MIEATGGLRRRKKEKRSASIMQKVNNLQDVFLTQARRERRQVTMFLMNGFQMRGVVSGFDAFTVILMSEGKQQMVYKHAISTITPERPLPLEAEPPAPAEAIPL